MQSSSCGAMAVAGSRQTYTPEAFRSQVIPPEICGGQSDIDTGFSASTSVLP
jgi:hypothetical protein